MKKRMRQLTTVNSTLILKYTCTVCMHSKNEMVVMTIPYGYFSCMYSLLFVDSFVKLTCMHLHSFHTSLLFPMMCMPHSSVIV